MTYDGKFKAVTIVTNGLKSEWDVTTKALPPGAVIYETDTQKVKIMNGISLYKDIPYASYSDINAAILEALANPNQPKGVAALNTIDAVVPNSLIPSDILNKPLLVFVNTIEERDALTPDYRRCIVVVLDATGDPAVSRGAATYIYANNEWVRFGKDDSMDITTDPYFDKDADTFDSISDGSAYVKTTSVEYATLHDLKNTCVKIKARTPYRILALTHEDFMD